MIDEITVTVVQYGDRKNLMMRYVDPITGKQIARSTGETNRRKAERIAAKWESELREGRYAKQSNILWEDFRERYEQEVAEGLADNTYNLVATTFNTVETILKPTRLRDLTADRLSHFQAMLRKRSLSEHTIRCYLAHLRSSLSWAVSTGLLSTLPAITFPKRAKKLTVMKGRPISESEFGAMIAAVDEITAGECGELWKQLLRGLWFSGLRLSEALNLTWDDRNRIMVDFTQRRPLLHIPAEMEKGHVDRLYPIAPEFAQFLDSVDLRLRTGIVFPLVARYGQARTCKTDWASRVICRFGRAAGIEVGSNPRTGKIKFASAHDLRRSFGDRWARLVMPQTLKEMMRHASIETTLRYYVGQNAEKTADILWEVYESGIERNENTD